MNPPELYAVASFDQYLPVQTDKYEKYFFPIFLVVLPNGTFASGVVFEGAAVMVLIYSSCFI